MKEIISANGNLYQLVRTIREDQLKNPNFDDLRKYFHCDTLLRKQGLLYFCRLIEEIEYCVAAACNDVAIKFSNEFTTPKISGLDLMKLLFFNDPIPELHTHSYGFNTATGRNIIETLQMKYYEYKN